MAKIGEELPQPEKGWKRYDDKFPAIKYTGEWFRTNIRSYTEGTTDSSNHMSFFIIGSKFRILGAMTPSTNLFSSSNVKIEIDGVVHTFANNALAPKENSITKALLFEITLNEGVHFVKIYLNESGRKFWFDALDIDEDGRLMHPDEVTELQDLAIGKRIRCHYQAKSNEVGVFSGLGEETSNFIPPESSAIPSGDFYFICVDRDHLGRWKLIADRNIQHSISWDTLNSAGIASTGSQSNISLLDMTPRLSSNNPTMEGEVIFSSQWPQSVGGEAYMVFNKGRSPWYPKSNTPNEYIGFRYNEPKIITQYAITSYGSSTGNAAFTNWKFQGSRDGVIWIDLDVNTGVKWNSGERKVYPISNKESYSYYRILRHTKKEGYADAIRELDFFSAYITPIVEGNPEAVIRLMTGGIDTSDKDNEWNKYIVHSDLNGTIEAGDNHVWNWDGKTGSWTSTSSHHSSGGFRIKRGSGGSKASVSGHFESRSDSQTIDEGFRPVLLIESKNRNKSFILYENEAYYYNNGWINLGAIPDDAEAKKQLFEQYGMEYDITGQQLKELKKMLLTNNGA